MTEPEVHLFIDGDIIAFKAAAACQQFLQDSFGIIRPFANTKAGEAVVENLLHRIKQGLKSDTYEVILTDPKHNWRKDVDPTYKTNRVGERPLLLDYLKDYLRTEHGAYHWEGLEADDVLGIKMTTPRVKSVPDLRVICVGRDKDFKSIPGLHHTLGDEGPNKELIVREVTQWEGDRFHMIQTLAGDKVDGYDGCPGIGMDRAAKIIDTPTILHPTEGVKTRGVNKGESVTRWVSEPTNDYWACIVSHYRKAGLTEEDALRTARMARILRFGEYDPKTEELTLWVPSMLDKVGQR